MVNHFAIALKYFAYVLICYMAFESSDTILDGLLLFSFTFGALYFAYLLDEA